MARRALLTSKALNFLYEIPADEFVQTNVCTDCSPKIRHYTTDIIVDKHPEYPDIPPSVWTVKVSITDSDCTVSETIEPKSGPVSLSNGSLVLVEWRIRRSRNVKDAEKDPFCGDCHWHIGPNGFIGGRFESLTSLVGFHLDNYRQGHRGFIRDAYVLVSLTFTVRKTTTCRGLETLYESGMLADCTLKCGDQEFSAHRAILASQSPVFAAMFHNDMKEKSSGICSINDVRSDVLDALLQYVYTRELTKADGKLEELWIAADMYDIQDLKVDCERLILRSMADDNAVGYLNFGVQRGLSRIVVEAAKVIAQRPV